MQNLKSLLEKELIGQEASSASYATNGASTLGQEYL